MSYSLESIVGMGEINREVLSNFSSIKLVTLKQKIWLIPLTSGLLNELNQVNETREVQGLTKLQSVSTGSIWLAQQLSQYGRVAYLEAEFFGGVGGQASAGWHNQDLIFQVQAPDAIDQALRWLGVLRDNEQDEFDMIGLGRRRKTEDWAQ